VFIDIFHREGTFYFYDHGNIRIDQQQVNFIVSLSIFKTLNSLNSCFYLYSFPIEKLNDFGPYHFRDKFPPGSCDLS